MDIPVLCISRGEILGRRGKGDPDRLSPGSRTKSTPPSTLPREPPLPNPVEIWTVLEASRATKQSNMKVHSMVEAKKARGFPNYSPDPKVSRYGLTAQWLQDRSGTEVLRLPWSPGVPHSTRRVSDYGRPLYSLLEGR